VAQAREFNAKIELGGSVAIFRLDFFIGSSEGKPYFGEEYTPPGHITDELGELPASETLFMRVTGTAGIFPFGRGYEVRLDGQPVPIPPAILLFISALAGFGVIGRNGVRSTS
jgi:hypothetical protein